MVQIPSIETTMLDEKDSHSRSNSSEANNKTRSSGSRFLTVSEASCKAIACGFSRGTGKYASAAVLRENLIWALTFTMTAPRISRTWRKTFALKRGASRPGG